jgi:hypothetical protein
LQRCKQISLPRDKIMMKFVFTQRMEERNERRQKGRRREKAEEKRRKALRCNRGVRRGQKELWAVETAKAGKPSSARPWRVAADPPRCRCDLSHGRWSFRSFSGHVLSF